MAPAAERAMNRSAVAVKAEGGGAGLSVTPIALLTIDQEGAQVYSLGQKGSVSKLVELIPEVMSKMGKPAQQG